MQLGDYHKSTQPFNAGMSSLIFKNKIGKRTKKTILWVKLTTKPAKKNDIKILKSFGVTKNEIRSIFFNMSMLTIIGGTLIGLAIGLLLAFLQQTYGFISMGKGSFVVNAYPVLIKLIDIFVVSITVLLIGIFASWYQAKILSRKLF